jgi:hypothetical protein
MTARRLLLTTAELELLRRRTVPVPVLPPGLDLRPLEGAGAARALAVAGEQLRQRGLLRGAVEPHPALAADLLLLAAAEVTVLVQAARPGLRGQAVLAVRGRRGVSLLRTDDAHVQLSAFRSSSLAVELARVVPAAVGAPPLAGPVQVPLADLLQDRPGGTARRLHARWAGALHATVLGRRPTLPLEWAWLTGPDGGGWVGLEPTADRCTAPHVRLVPAEPADLGAWLAPRVAQALAAQVPA